jgi:AcrR family transcriptional regulator
VTAHPSPLHELLLVTGARLLEARPYETVTLRMVAKAADVEDGDATREFETLHALGSAILTAEGKSMRDAQTRAEREVHAPLARLQRTFRLVGDNLACSGVVRAGVRIAAESAHCFPERDINPFRTWENFITKVLVEAREAGLLWDNVILSDTAWLLTAAGIGTKDLLFFTGEWESAPVRLESIAAQVVATISRDASIMTGRS